MSAAGPAKPKVAVVYTSPETVIDDIGRVMRLAEYESFLPKDVATLLKINISWQHYYPACSTSPWQLDGVVHALKDDGYSDLIPAHNGTVVVDPVEGAQKNKHEVVERKHGLESVFLDFPPVNWVDYTPKAKMLVLDDIYPEGLQIPEMFFGKSIVHLPTMKTHVFTTITGAMKNAFGGLLNRKRHWTHSVIHETLVDLLNIQKEIHPGIFAVTDGTFVGDGPGPRAMRWHEKNVILAGADQVAVDAVSAKMMGFDPMNIPIYQARPRDGSRGGRNAGHRDCWRGHLGCRLEDGRDGKHIRQQGPEAHLLGATQTDGELLAPLPHRSMVIRSVQPLSQHLLDAVHRTQASPCRDEDGVGPPVSAVLIFHLDRMHGPSPGRPQFRDT